VICGDMGICVVNMFDVGTPFILYLLKSNMLNLIYFAIIVQLTVFFLPPPPPPLGGGG